MLAKTQHKLQEVRLHDPAQSKANIEQNHPSNNQEKHKPHGSEACHTNAIEIAKQRKHGPTHNEADTKQNIQTKDEEKNNQHCTKLASKYKK